MLGKKYTEKELVDSFEKGIKNKEKHLSILLKNIDKILKSNINKEQKATNIFNEFFEMYHRKKTELNNKI